MSWDHKRQDNRMDHSFQLTQKIIRDVPPLLSPEDPNNSAKGKIVVITGGATGIGAAAARVWTRAGATGVVIAETTTILAVPTDVTKVSDTENLFNQVNGIFGAPADVVLSNAGTFAKKLKPHEESSEEWWSKFEINTLGTHNLAASFIRSQSDPSSPVGTFISTNSGLAALVAPGLSGYSIAKMAAQRYIEYLDVEYPTLKCFTLFPGIVKTDMLDPFFEPYALDHPDQTGALALYLASQRADYLKGSLVSINWDVEEMEKHKEEIEKGLLKIKYVPVLPVSGGKGFE